MYELYNRGMLDTGVADLIQSNQNRPRHVAQRRVYFRLVNLTRAHILH